MEKVKRILPLVMLAAACCSPNVENNANFVAVQPLPPPKVESEKVERYREPPQSETLAIVNVPLPPDNLPKRTWPSTYFAEIVRREKISRLQRLRSKVLAENDIEIRVWSGFGGTLLEGFILKREGGRWWAVDLGGAIGTRTTKRTLAAPASGWEGVWERLVEAGILTLPSAEETTCSEGSHPERTSVVIEYMVGNNYRAYMYDQPYQPTCDEGEKLLQILEMIYMEFNHADNEYNLLPMDSSK